MKNKLFLISSCLAVLLLASCTFAASEPTPTATFTPSPTETPLPTATKTLPPPTPTEDFLAALAPVGDPASEWNGIPVMPGAIAGEGDDDGYTFTIQSTAEEIQAFYERELAKQGITLLAVGDGQNGSILLIFMKDLETVSVSIFPYEDLFIVLLVK